MYLRKVDRGANYRFFPILKRMYVSLGRRGKRRERIGEDWIYFLPIWKEVHMLTVGKNSLVQQSLKSKRMLMLVFGSCWKHFIIGQEKWKLWWTVLWLRRLQRKIQQQLVCNSISRVSVRGEYFNDSICLMYSLLILFIHHFPLKDHSDQCRL